MTDLPDKIHLPATRCDVGRVEDSNAPLDPKVLAQIRREEGDQAQLTWDVSVNPAAMLKALFKDEPSPAILLPPVRFIEFATKRFEERGRRVDPLIWRQTMMTSAKMVLRGQFNTAAVWLRHAYTGAGLALTPQEAYGEMASMVRHFFPCAPRGWTDVGKVNEKKVLEDRRDETKEYGPSCLAKPRHAWKRLNGPSRRVKAEEKEPNCG